MKTKMTALAMAILISASGLAQTKGSGKTVSKIFDYRDFDKIAFNDLNGKIVVTIGKPWSIAVTIDDNLTDLLDVKLNPKEHQLDMSLKGNKNNKLYIENTHIKIKITMPEVSVISQDGNSNIEVNNINGRYFKMINRSNGDARLQGIIDILDIQHSGNGNIDAQNLTAKKADISSNGNGDVSVNATQEIAAHGSGNGDIINVGDAEFKTSVKTGNGNLINRKNKKS